MEINTDYSTDASASVTLSSGATNLNLAYYATLTTNLVSAGVTNQLGIGVLSLSYAISSLVFNYFDATATTVAPAVADFECGATESATLLPLCAIDLVTNYLYDEVELYTAVVGFKQRKTVAAITKADYLSHIRTIRGDRRFRLYSGFFPKYQEWNKVKRATPTSTTIESTVLTGWVNSFDTLVPKKTIGNVYS